jgi:D-sedoheptulose 7-phosphate isomerase
MEKKMDARLSELIKRYPVLSSIKDSIFEAFSIMVETFENDGTLFACGNGGSAADGDHIVGELMKGFVLRREIDGDLKDSFLSKLGEDGQIFADKLQKGLKAVSLTSHPALITAFSNDVDPSLIYAQQLFVLGRKGDVLVAISTSGNSDNIYKCMQLASVVGIKTILMTGDSGGRCAKIADCPIKVPESETFKIQEYHLPIYHTLCLMLEEKFYGGKK